jgi:hypothetical protein
VRCETRQIDSGVNSTPPLTMGYFFRDSL